jgi:hypothetical protein
MLFIYYYINPTANIERGERGEGEERWVIFMNKVSENQAL